MRFPCAVYFQAYESRWLGFQRKVAGRLPLRLNTARRPIANKYCEGKMKTTLKSELKEAEIEHGETLEISAPAEENQEEADGPAWTHASFALFFACRTPHRLGGPKKGGGKVASAFASSCYRPLHNSSPRKRGSNTHCGSHLARIGRNGNIFRSLPSFR